MNNTQKIKIAKDFAALHKDDDIREWDIRNKQTQRYFEANDEAHLTIFYNLMGGLYGNIESNAELDDETGELIKEADQFQIEIDSSQSHSGNPIIFDWYGECEE
ncbi:MAG: hypothetical protein JKX76_13385 [Colwellia sp.]|nr:hypothetical protein [Colwellia sp.]